MQDVKPVSDESPDANDEQQITIDLKNPNLAAFLAWLVPGLGHMYQGRWAKGILFMVCVLGTFLFGFYLGEGRVVYAAWEPDIDDRRLPWYAMQAGAGLPALPALVQANVSPEKRPNLFGGYYAPPRFTKPYFDGRGEKQKWKDPDGKVYQHELAKWQQHIQGFELGTVYTMIAGLLNVLVIYDAWGGPVIAVPSRKRKRKKKPIGETSPSD